ncbi:hypothetical protein RND81_03G108200 [Saponaria officinalis]|uniref:Uncharacterized protein n=1 Tax=Saponaria officinalis TaxID=3572 RepID=A0AAW1M2Q9_SAPOF
MICWGFLVLCFDMKILGVRSQVLHQFDISHRKIATFLTILIDDSTGLKNCDVPVQRILFLIDYLWRLRKSAAFPSANLLLLSVWRVQYASVWRVQYALIFIFFVRFEKLRRS